MSDPQWKINKRIRNHAYEREHGKKITIHLREKDEHIIEVFSSIPNKAEWFRQKVLEYEKESS